MSFTVESIYPINPDFGVHQGVPIARYYIDQYIASIAPKISGRVLEFGSPTYAAKLDCSYDIADIDRNNPLATVWLDICDDQRRGFPSTRYDFIISTAVLHLVSSPQKAVDNLHALLKPGGKLILAEKCLSKIDSWFASVDRWRFTPNGLRLLLSAFSRVEVTSFGNVYAMCAYLLGIPAEGTERDKLSYVDPEYPLVSIGYAER
jgi:SAM-dependent methyltransferase